MSKNNDKYFETLNYIKKTLIASKSETAVNTNKDLILMYYNIGLKLIKNNKWGSYFIDTLAEDLKTEFPTLKGTSSRNLRYMQKLASEFDNDEFFRGVIAKLSWTHNIILLDRVKDKEIRKWYAKEAIENGWSTSILIRQISNKLYERQPL